MIRLNRSRFLGIACLTIFIYFLLFTDSGTSSSEFRANTETGLARKRQREQELPLRGHLSDEDLTKKTHDELQGILNSQSREGVKKDEHGDTVGRVSREPQHDAPTRDHLRKEGMTRQDPPGHNRAGESGQQKMDHDVEGAEDAEVPQRKTTYKSKDTAVRTEKEKALNNDVSDAEAESEEDPGKAFVTKRLDEYLKSPGMDRPNALLLNTPLTSSQL